MKHYFVCDSQDKVQRDVESDNYDSTSILFKIYSGLYCDFA